MNEHTVIEHLGNLGVILLAVLLSTSVHYLFLKTPESGRTSRKAVSPDSTGLWRDRLADCPFH